MYKSKSYYVMLGSPGMYDVKKETQQVQLNSSHLKMSASSKKSVLLPEKVMD